jgi:hypothetical protein
MLAIPTEILALLEDGRFSVRLMIRFALPTGAVGLWNDTYPISHDGVTYSPLAGNMDMDPIPGASQLHADKVSVQISNLNEDIAGIVAQHQWHQCPVLIYMAFLDDAGLVKHLLVRFSGFLDAISISDRDTGASVINLAIESNNRELNRKGGRARSDSDQRQVLASDGFFKHTLTSNVNNNIYWGRKGPHSPQGDTPVSTNGTMAIRV